MKNTTTRPTRISINTVAEFTIKCQEHMLKNGLPCDDELIFDGSLYRYSADDNPYKCDEWYIGNIEELPNGEKFAVCTYGSWSTQEKFTYKSADIKELSKGMDMKQVKQELKERRDTVKEKRERQAKLQHDKAAKHLCIEYRGTKKGTSKMNLLMHKPMDGEYLRRKGIKPYENSYWPIKFHEYTEKSLRSYRAMVIPIINIENQLRSCEYIYYKNGECVKKFYAGGEKKGNFYPLGAVKEFDPTIEFFDGQKDAQLNHIYVAEGYATACSLYETVRYLYSPGEFTVVVAFDAGNMIHVVGNLRQLFTTQKIIICPDNDIVGHREADRVCSFYNCIKMKQGDIYER